MILTTAFRPAPLALLLSAFVTGAAGASDVNKAQGLRLDNPDVLDLAARKQKSASANAVPIVILAAADGEKILATPTLSEEPLLPFSNEVYGCDEPSKACLLEHERKLIAASDSMVKRDGKRLTIEPAAGTTAIFVDWKMPETKTADGDEETHWYLGRMPGNGYHRVEVQFGHDAPGNFLINPHSGKIAFVHNGADVAAPSQDGMYLVTFNTLNPPLSIRLGAFDAAGPRLQLQCTGVASAYQARAEFRGWHDARSFDLVIRPDGDKGKAAIPLRIAQTGEAWSIATPDPSQLVAIGFSCH